MRLLLALGVVAAAVSAEPSVRWLDSTGAARREAVSAVLVESLTSVKVRTSEGKVLDIPGTDLLGLVRERDDVPEERALLHARRSVEWGMGLAQARPVLDRILATAKGWKREYAMAARAVLAQRAGDKDAESRIVAFEKAYPRSRFLPEVWIAEAQIASSKATDPKQVILAFHDCRNQIRRAGGPRLLEARSLVAAAECMIRTVGVGDAEPFLSAVERRANNADKDKSAGIAWRICIESARYWVRLEAALADRDAVVRIGKPPDGALVRIRHILDRCQYLLPELESDVHRELGKTLALVGKKDEALKELEIARNLAPDEFRVELAENAIVGIRAAEATVQPKSKN